MIPRCLFGASVVLLAACSSLKTVPDDSLVHVEPVDMPALVQADQSLTAAREDAARLRDALAERTREKRVALREAERANKRVDKLERRKQDAVARADAERTSELHVDLERARTERERAGERLTAAVVAQRAAEGRLAVAEAKVEERAAWREFARASAVAEGGGEVKVKRYKAQHQEAEADLEKARSSSDRLSDSSR